MHIMRNKEVKPKASRGETLWGLIRVVVWATAETKKRELGMDKIILKQVAGGTKSDPLYGEYQTFILDIDDQDHRLWLNKQYKQGSIMTAHSFIKTPNSKQIIHIPTN
jgi:hypothetical protein